MQKDTEVVPRSQGSPSSPHQRGTGTNLNPAGVSLYTAPTGGITNYNTGTASKYRVQTSERRVYFSGSAKPPFGVGGRSIGNEGRTPEYMAIVDNQVERPRHREVGKLVSITQLAFRDGYILEAMTWKMMVLISKGGVGYIGIGLIKVTWKV